MFLCISDHLISWLPDLNLLLKRYLTSVYSEINYPKNIDKYLYCRKKGSTIYINLNVELQAQELNRRLQLLEKLQPYEMPTHFEVLL